MVQAGILRAATLVCTVVSVAALTSCSGGGGHSAAPTTTLPLAGTALASVVIPPPAGFQPSIESDAHNGALSTKDFDDYIYDPEAARNAHLIGAYQATYDSLSSTDSILVVVAQLRSPTDAQQFDHLDKHTGPFRASRAEAAVAARVSALRGVPGGVQIDPTKADSVDNTFDHAIAAVKGSRVMFIDYITEKKGPVRGLAQLAAEQYRRL